MTRIRAVARTRRAVILAYLEDIHSKPALKRENAACTIRFSPGGSAWLVFGVRRTAARAPTHEWGRASIGMLTARQLCRNRYTTPTTRKTATTIVFSTS